MIGQPDQLTCTHPTNHRRQSYQQLREPFEFLAATTNGVILPHSHHIIIIINRFLLCVCALPLSNLNQGLRRLSVNGHPKMPNPRTLPTLQGSKEKGKPRSVLSTCTEQDSVT